MACWLCTHGEKCVEVCISVLILGKRNFILFVCFSVASEGKREQEMSVPRFLNTRRPFRCSFLIVCLNLYLYEVAEILVPTLLSHADFENSSKQNIIQVCLLSLEYLNAKNPSRYLFYTTVLHRSQDNIRTINRLLLFCWIFLVHSFISSISNVYKFWKYAEFLNSWNVVFHLLTCISFINLYVIFVYICYLYRLLFQNIGFYRKVN